MSYKRINIFLVILLLVIMGLNAISASDNTTSVDNGISKIDTHYDSNIDIASNEKIVEKKNVKTENNNIIVNNYDELYTTIAESNSSDLSIELKGDKEYKIDRKIEVDTPLFTLKINGNNRVLNGNNQCSFMKISNSYAHIEISNIKVINCNESYGSVLYNKGFLTIQNSSFNNNHATSDGGVIYNTKNLTINNCTFEDNICDSRGGVINSNKQIHVTDSLFNNNTASSGGTFYIHGNTNSIIENNIINNSHARFAGSIFSYGLGNLTITNNTIVNSIAQMHGGALLNHGSLDINVTGNNISNNKASWAGAIITLDQMNINNNSFNNNTAEYGGVIFNGGDITLKFNNFTNNDASIGGCIYNCADSTLNSTYNTFTNNTAVDGAVLYNSGNSIFNANMVMSNIASKGHVIKSDTDLINDDSSHNMEIKNNYFVHNTDNKRDMLLSNNGTLNISGNVYISNCLDLNISKLENLSYIDVMDTNLSVTPNNIYNTTLNGGYIQLSINKDKYNFRINNNTSRIYLNSSTLDNQNIIKICYNDSDNNFKSTNYTYNVSMYKNTMIKVTTQANVKYRDILKINANVTDLYGKFVDKGYVIYKINGITLTDSNGLIRTNVRNKTINYDYQLPKNFNIKEYTLELIYSGNPDNYNSSRNTIKFNITKTTSQLIVTTNKNSCKMDENITFTAKLNSKYEINEGVMIFKVNGVTVKDKNNKPILVNVTNNTASIVFTIPDGWSAKSIKVSAVYSNKNYERLENKTTFNIIKTTPKFNITNIKLTNNSISVKGKLVDEYGHYIRGINGVVIKINSLTIKRENDKAQVFVVENGVIDIKYTLLINLKKNEYKVDFVTGERNAYKDTRLTITTKNY